MPSDGELRLNNGELERYISNGDMWILPEMYAYFQTAHRLIRNFGTVQFQECAFNLYSAGCWENINQLFTHINDNEGILVQVNKDVTTLYSWYQFYVMGPWLLLIWLCVGIPVILNDPENSLPPATDDGYAYMNFEQWLWFKYLSFDSQIVLMHIGLQVANTDTSTTVLQYF